MSTELTYRVLDVPNVVDGDTLWAVLERDVKKFRGHVMWRNHREEIVGEAGGRQLIEQCSLRGHFIVERDYPGGTKIRLHDWQRGLNTPEAKHKLPHDTARRDLLAYLDRWNGREQLTLKTYGKDSFVRTLGDLQPPRYDRVESAVFWMRDKGWEAYR